MLYLSYSTNSLEMSEVYDLVVRAVQQVTSMLCLPGHGLWEAHLRGASFHITDPTIDYSHFSLTHQAHLQSTYRIVVRSVFSPSFSPHIHIGHDTSVEDNNGKRTSVCFTPSA